ncbi:hypothetical protein Y1Q_0006457 [Alligator mississippiensis]|uniref:Uncharacterized protein n=1 Tax=Alligator mississippiensis TaxID=8496 RepID=A0A151N186_ALLMI|nr:hypothetical protein Y1Q_0006457 [Alligator mississippiensis]
MHGTGEVAETLEELEEVTRMWIFCTAVPCVPDVLDSPSVTSIPSTRREAGVTATKGTADPENGAPDTSSQEGCSLVCTGDAGDAGHTGTVPWHEWEPV